MVEPENLIATLQERVREFGEKPAYILSSEELAAGIEYAIFHVLPPDDCGDGTVITKVTFEGKTFLCVTEKD